MKLNYLHPSKQRTPVGNYCAAAKQANNGTNLNKTCYANVKEIQTCFDLSSKTEIKLMLLTGVLWGNCKRFPESNAYA